MKRSPSRGLRLAQPDLAPGSMTFEEADILSDDLTQCLIPHSIRVSPVDGGLARCWVQVFAPPTIDAAFRAELETLSERNHARLTLSSGIFTFERE